jgi:hypothetical protein
MKLVRRIIKKSEGQVEVRDNSSIRSGTFDTFEAGRGFTLTEKAGIVHPLHITPGAGGDIFKIVGKPAGQSWGNRMLEVTGGGLGLITVDIQHGYEKVFQNLMALHNFFGFPESLGGKGDYAVR